MFKFSKITCFICQSQKQSQHNRSFELLPRRTIRLGHHREVDSRKRFRSGHLRMFKSDK